MLVYPSLHASPFSIASTIQCLLSVQYNLAFDDPTAAHILYDILSDCFQVIYGLDMMSQTCWGELGMVGMSHLGYFCGVRYEGNFSVWVDRVEN
jgi:hypothetical protein